MTQALGHNNTVLCFLSLCSTVIQDTQKPVPTARVREQFIHTHTSCCWADSVFNYQHHISLLFPLHIGKLRLSHPRQTTSMLKTAVGGGGRYVTKASQGHCQLPLSEERLEGTHSEWDVPTERRKHFYTTKAREWELGTWLSGCSICHVSVRNSLDPQNPQKNEHGVEYLQSQKFQPEIGGRQENPQSLPVSQPRAHIGKKQRDPVSNEVSAR